MFEGDKTVSPTKKAVKKKDTEPKKIAKQIRFKKPFAANIPGQLSDTIRSISPNNAKSYYYREGQVPGVGCPVLPNELSFTKEPKLDENGEQETKRTIRNGNEVFVSLTYNKPMWLYDALIKGGVAEPINMRSPINDGTSQEDILLQVEMDSGIAQEELDTIYRDYGARTIAEKMKVLDSLSTAQADQEEQVAF